MSDTPTPFTVDAYWPDDCDDAGTWLSDASFATLPEARAAADAIACGGEKAVITQDGKQIFSEE
jgi:hypothetical protein